MAKAKSSLIKGIVISVIAAGLVAAGTLTYSHLHAGRDWTMARIFTIEDNEGGPANLKWLKVYRSGLLVELDRIDISRFKDYVWQRHNHLREYRKANIPERQQREREMIDLLSQEMFKVLIAGGVDPEEAKNLCSHGVESVITYGGFED